MTQFNRILVPTDFSACSEQAIDVAVHMARAFDASIVLMHALDLTQKASVLASTSGAIPLVDFGEDPARRSLDETLRTTRARWPRTEAVMRIGIPSEEILHAVRETPADLIIMGTHGRRGVLHALVGSVTQTMVRTSTVPVVTVRQA